MINRKFTLLLFLVTSTLSCQQNTESPSYDVVVYGATSAGIAAAVQVTRMGKSVLVVEPSDHIGGLTTGGLGQTDIGNKQVIGGISKEFYEGIAQKYSKDENWSWQKKEAYKNKGQGVKEKASSSMWTFEPRIAQEVFQDMIKENDIPIILNERLMLTNGVVKQNGKIVSFKTQSGKVFIDATYEGDLMAKTGVSYTVGREANAQYGETLNGVQKKLGHYHQFTDGVDPYKTKGDPDSGLLQNINSKAAQDGSGDKMVQGYCFRMCLTAKF